MADGTGPDGEVDWKASYFAALAENSRLRAALEEILAADPPHNGLGCRYIADEALSVSTERADDKHGET